MTELRLLAATRIRYAIVLIVHFVALSRTWRIVGKKNIADMDAPKLALPAEICAQVVQYARFGDLPAIGRTSKAFQILAETRLYNHIIVKDTETLNRVGNSLFTPARGLARAPYVRRLWVYRDPRTAEGPWRDAHWRAIVILLPMVINLDNLIIWDDTSVHTWCLDAPTIRFQVREANFVFNWDDSLASFLEGQHELRSLIIQAPDEDENTRRILAPGSLQKLESFDGPLFVAIDLMTSPLKRLCIRVDEENAPLFSSYITELSRVNKTLSSLNVLHVPEYLVADSLRVLALSPLSSSLRYLGIVNLPLGDVCFYRSFP